MTRTYRKKRIERTITPTLLRVSNIIVRSYTNRIDYFSNVFPLSNLHSKAIAQISMKNWKFRFFFILPSYIEPILMTYEICWI
jgi:hypothetical protein